MIIRRLSSAGSARAVMEKLLQFLEHMEVFPERHENACLR